MSRSIPKEWIKIPHRNKSEYIKGVQFFMDFAMKHSLPGLTTCSCPCKKCRNAKRASFEVVRRHLIINGMLPTYDVWSLHGEKPGMDMTGGPKQQFVEEDQTHDQVQCPDDIDKIWWKKFIANEYTTKKIEQRKKNAENKAQCKISHALGRKSYKRLYEELEEEHPAEGVTRLEAWKRAHKSKTTGNVLPCALKKYNELEAAEQRQKLTGSASGHGGVSSLEDLETDPIAEIFGVDKKSRCRAVSSTSSVKQVKIRQAAKAIASKNTNPEVLKRLDNVEVMLREMLTYVYTTHQPQNPNFASGTPETEGASNSVHINRATNLNPVLNTVDRVHGNNNSSHVVHDNNDGPAPRGKQNVILLGREREDVAKGFIASHSTCHGRKVQDDEKIVYVSEVIKPEAPVYDGPQDGISFLCEIADGGFLIWGGKRIRYL